MLHWLAVLYQLDGSDSSDPDGDSLEFNWALVERPTASNASLDAAAAPGPGFVPDAAGDYKFQLIVSDGEFSSMADEVVISTQNRVPVADAGIDVSALVGSLVTLDGRASSDPDDDPLSYRWRLLEQPAGADIALSDLDSVQPSFTLSAAGQYRFELIVSDGELESAPDQVNVQHQNRAPIADAGVDQVLALGSTVSLDGGGSSEPDGQPLAFRWQFVDRPGASAAELNNPTSRTPQFSLDVPGRYEIQLIVSDGEVDSAADSVVINHINLLPVANAGPDLEVVLPANQSSLTVRLDGRASLDPDGSVREYNWSGTPQPADSALSEVELGLGTFSFTLIVVDDSGAQSAGDEVIITVLPAGPDNIAPVANAGDDRALTLFASENAVSVLLDGSLSSDSDGTIANYAWSGSPTPDAIATPAVELGLGIHTFSLTVTDELGLTSSADTVTIEVNPLPAQNAPQVVAVPAVATIAEGESLSVSLSASDADGDRLSLSAEAVVENSSFSANNGVDANGIFEFTPDFSQAGRYRILFTARDPLGLTGQASVDVTVVNTNRPPAVEVASQLSVREGEVLSFALSTSDPDLDPVTVVASEMPANGLFIPGSNQTLFAPDFDQAGEYDVRYVGSDGELDSELKTVRISVIDVPVATVGGANALELRVDPAESPTLLGTARITGTVNASAQAPQVPKAVSALITSVTPATGRQGSTVSVDLRSGTDPRFLTHFEAQLSAADFGAGTAVQTVEVIDASHLRVTLTIEPDAELGPRAVTVQTEREVAVSLVAFSIVPGTTSVSGRLVDPDNGQAIANALVTVPGTNARTTTDADGRFVLTEVPPGAQRLIVNPVNFDALVVDINLDANTDLDIGDLQSRTLVFDPNSAPSVSVPSVVARGVGEKAGNIGVDEARQLVIDTYLAVGGDQIGLYDESGNQLNPLVGEEPLAGLPAELIDHTAELLAKGDNTSLGEILYALVNIAEWEGGTPSLAQLLSGMQQMVDLAWADRRAPAAGIVLAIFANSSRLSPNPPILTPNTELSALQRQLLVVSFLAFIQENIDLASGGISLAPLEFERASWLAQVIDFLVPAAQAQGLPDPRVPNPLQSPNLLTAYWKGIIEPLAGNPRSIATDQAARVFTVSMSRLTPSLYSPPSGGSAGSAVQGFLVGKVQDLLVDLGVSLILQTLTPRAPIILGTAAIPVGPVDDNGDQAQIAVIEFSRAIGDNGIDNEPGKRFIYRLWRWDTVGGKLSQLRIGMARDESNDSLLKVREENDQVLAFFDLTPNPGHNVYMVDVVRTIGAEADAVAAKEVKLPWFKGFLPTNTTLGSGALAFNPVSAFTSLMSPLIKIANGIRVMSSPLSENAAVFIGARSQLDAAAGFVVDPGGRALYESIPSENQFYKIDPRTLEREAFVSANFAAPHQSGLAIDPAGALYSENSATDNRFGGKIFQYQGDGAAVPGARTHVGQSNYYSFLLGYARPTAVSAMAMSTDGELFIADSLEKRIKKVPVNRVYDAYRRVGQPYAESPLFQFGPGMDMAVSVTNAIFLTQPNSTNILRIDGFDQAISSLLPDDLDLLQRPRSVDLDNFGTVYIGDSGFNAAADGRVIALPRHAQGLFATFDDCAISRYTVLSGLQNLSYVRLNHRKDTLYYRENGTVKQLALGISGQVFDVDGEPVANATIRISRNSGAVSQTYRTDACGAYHAFELADSGGSGIAEFSISADGIGSQSYAGFVTFSGHRFRDFVLDAPLPPPTPPDNEPIADEPPLESPPPPAPVTVAVTSGTTNFAPPITMQTVVVEDEECAGAAAPSANVSASDISTSDNDDRCDVSVRLPDTVREAPFAILSPVDGQEIGIDALGDLQDVEVVIGSNATLATEMVGAKAFAVGQDIVFSESATPKVLAEEVTHTLDFGGTDATLSPAGQSTIGVELQAQSVAEGAAIRSVTISHPLETVVDADGVETTQYAPASTGAVVGMVQNENGEGLAGVSVSNSGSQESTYTDEYGVYRFPRVEPGSQTVRVEQ